MDTQEAKPHRLSEVFPVAISNEHVAEERLQAVKNRQVKGLERRTEGRSGTLFGEMTNRSLSVLLTVVVFAGILLCGCQPQPLPPSPKPPNPDGAFEAIVKRYAPLVRLHQNERYFPCGIEYLLQNSVLRNEGDFERNDPTQADLQKYCETGYYVEVNSSQYGGMIENGKVTAPIYYAIQEYADSIQISYLMLYAYQGAQTCRQLLFGNEFNFVANTLGVHQGDLELVVVTLAPNGPGEYRVASVGYEAHGHMKYLRVPTCLVSLYATSRVPSALDRSMRGCRNFAKVEAILGSARKSGSVFRRAVAATC